MVAGVDTNMNHENNDMKPLEEMTTIAIPKGLKNRLDKIKVHPREPYAQVIVRMYNAYIDNLASEWYRKKELLRELDQKDLGGEK